MKCPNCKEEIRMDFYDETPGAVFVALDSGTGFSAWVWPAIWGIKKYDGCVVFGRGVDNASLDECCTDNIGVLSKVECEGVYFDYPTHGGQAWLVKPLKEGYEWTRVDEQIEFSVQQKGKI